MQTLTTKITRMGPVSGQFITTPLQQGVLLKKYSWTPLNLTRSIQLSSAHNSWQKNQEAVRFSLKARRICGLMKFNRDERWRSLYFDSLARTKIAHVDDRALQRGHMQMNGTHRYHSCLSNLSSRPPVLQGLTHTSSVSPLVRRTRVRHDFSGSKEFFNLRDESEKISESHL